MHQVLHILRKDCRRLWPEVLLTSLTTAGFAVFYPAIWRPHEDFPVSIPGLSGIEDIRRFTAQTFITLVPILWIVLIVRVVQNDALVGDRQAWVTRPIDWRNLLAEKLLFVSLFAIVPFFIAQLVLLHRGGFSALHYGSEVLVQTALIVALLILPVFTLATVTRTFFRFTLTLLGLLSAIILLAVLSDRFISTSTPYVDHISPVALAAGCCLVILTQYASRTVWLGRCMLFAVAVCTVIIAVNPLEGILLDRVYFPRSSGPAPVHVVLSSDPKTPPTLQPVDDRYMLVSLPLQLQGVSYGKEIQVRDARLVLDAADGTHLDSGWQAVLDRGYGEQTRTGAVALKINRAWITQVRDKPVTAHLALALTELEEGAPLRVAFPSQGELILPTLGRCTVDPDLSRSPGLTCRWPVRHPHRVELRALWTSAACREDGTPTPDRWPLLAAAGADDAGPDITLTSVFVDALHFDYFGRTDAPIYGLPPVHLCPGDLITITPLTAIHQRRVDLPSRSFILSHPFNPSLALKSR